MIATKWAISSLLALWSLKIRIGIPRIIGLASHLSKGELKPRNGPDRGEGQQSLLLNTYEYVDKHLNEKLLTNLLKIHLVSC